MGSAAWAVAIALGLHPAVGGAEIRQAPPTTPATHAWPDDRPLTRLVQNLWRDVRDLPSERSLAILLAGSAGAGAARSQDHDIAAWIARKPAASYTRVGDVIGLGGIQAGVSLGTYAIGKLTGHAPATHVGSDLIRAQVLTAGITHGLKAGVGRVRPEGGRQPFPPRHTPGGRRGGPLTPSRASSAGPACAIVVTF
jgi:hypothetical protein